ncbi:Uridine diphosphate glucose pyrophosphatase NUDT14 [Pseudolycoriella hygida]|uniref:Uridine diphosphate glucose pyrophosphatase NUDT14 n=1 Tax=Pseudolycoriella hygida TaxID=35572 RepID=A0A9Q0MXK0_9DIPT|nr:Uridine diphosphate glucose pyrophosphatase NUDT14 [Pseudolycoriella hygida]
MENISNIRYGALPSNSPYIKPFRMRYVQDGITKDADLLKVHDSVCIIIYNRTTKKLIFVRQFRPAVYYAAVSENGSETDDNVNSTKYPPKLAITLELCAGIVDKDLPLKEIAREEILEECGFNISSDRIEEVMTYRSGVDTTGATQTMFYCEVTDDDRVTAGGGIDDEIIEVIELPMDEVEHMVKTGANVVSPPSFLLGVLWFLSNKKPQQ